MSSTMTQTRSTTYTLCSAIVALYVLYRCNRTQRSHGAHKFPMDTDTYDNTIDDIEDKQKGKYNADVVSSGSVTAGSHVRVGNTKDHPKRKEVQRSSSQSPPSDTALLSMLNVSTEELQLFRDVNTPDGPVDPKTYVDYSDWSSPRQRRMKLVDLLLQKSPFESASFYTQHLPLLTKLYSSHVGKIDTISLNYKHKRAPIYMLHFSKAGGTSLCSLSHYNRCKEHSNANNCWIPGNGPVWFASFKHSETACEQYEAIINTERLDLIGNEGYLDGGAGGNFPTLCPNMIYQTLVREPVARVLSHISQAGVRLDGYVGLVFRCLPDGVWP